MWWLVAKCGGWWPRFACADYPALPAFLASAAKEIRDNVLRLQAHPSIALWAGNNEDERDMSKAPKGDTAPAYVHAYSLLTFSTGLDNVSAIDSSRPLSGSSPSDGNETAAGAHRSQSTEQNSSALSVHRTEL